MRHHVAQNAVEFDARNDGFRSWMLSRGKTYDITANRDTDVGRLGRRMHGGWADVGSTDAPWGANFVKSLSDRKAALPIRWLR